MSDIEQWRGAGRPPISWSPCGPQLLIPCTLMLTSVRRLRCTAVAGHSRATRISPASCPAVLCRPLDVFVSPALALRSLERRPPRPSTVQALDRAAAVLTLASSSAVSPSRDVTAVQQVPRLGKAQPHAIDPRPVSRETGETTLRAL